VTKANVEKKKKKKNTEKRIIAYTEVNNYKKMK